MKKLLRKLFKKVSCKHTDLDFKGGYIDLGVRFECRECSRRVVIPMNVYMAINPVRKDEVVRDCFKALLSMREES